MVKKIICALAITLFAISAQAQNSIGVNTDTPNPNAAMDIKPVAGQAQGVLIPRLTTAERTGMSLGAADNGLMVYDETLGSLFIWNGVWNPVAIEGATVVTVDGITIIGDGGITPLGVNVGIGPDQVVQLDASSRLPAVDGSQLTGITPTLNPGDVTTTEILDGTITGADIAGSTIADGNISDVDFAKITNVPINLDIDATDDVTIGDLGTGPSQVVQLDGSARLPAVDGSQLTGITPTLNPGDVTTTEILDGTITGTDIAANTIADGNISDVDFGKLSNVPVNLDIDATDDITIADVGNTANQIVQLDGSARLPAVDGSQLTNLPPQALAANSVTTAEIADGTISGADIAGTTISDANINDVDFGKITNVPVNLDVDATDDITTADVGVGPNQIVQLDGTSRLPNVDGSQLTNLPIVPVNSDGTTVLGDGDATALNVNVGVGPNQIVQLDGTSRLPNVDGSQLTNLPIVPVNSDGTTVLGDGDATALNVNVGVGPNQIVQLDGTSRLPNVDGSQLTNLPITPVNSDGTTVLGDGDATALNVNVGVGPNQIVQLDGTSRLPNVDGSQLTNLPITPVNSDGTTVLGDGDATALNVNVGVGPNQIVQLDGSSRLPNVDGSLLTNLPNQALVGLTDVSFGPLSSGEILQYNGTDWNNASIVLADMGDVSFGALSGGEVLRYNGATWDGGFSVLGDNGDVIMGAPAAGEVLFYNGSDWANGNIGLADIGDVSFGALSGGEVLRYNGSTWDGGFSVLGDNGDVIMGAPAAGEVLFYNGSDWANGNIGLADIGDVSFGALSGGEVLRYNGSTWDGGFSVLGDNGDVIMGAPAAGEVLFYNGSDWANGNIGLADIGDVSFGALSGGEVLRYNGSTWDGGFSVLGDNGDVIMGAPTAGEVLFYNGSDWANGNIGLGDIGDVSLTALSGGEVLQYNGSEWASSSTLNGANLTLMQILDNVDNTKVATFDLSGISTATTHSYSFPDASGQIALLSDVSGASLWADNAGDINYSAGNVGVGTVTPKSTLQVGQSMGLSHFENSVQGIFGNIIGSDLYADKTNVTDNNLVRNSGASGSFIFFENGDLSFHHTPAGAADGVLNLTSDIQTSLTLYNNGTAEFQELVAFNSNEAIVLPAGTSIERDAIASPVDGMLRYNFDDTRFEGYVGGAWTGIGTASFSNINTPITFDGDASGVIQVLPPSSGQGGVLHLQSGDAAGGSGADGGNVVLQPGFGDGVGFDGLIDLQGDAYLHAGAIFSAGIDHDILVEGATSSVGNNLSIRAGDGDSGFNSGNLILAPGAGVGNDGHIQMDATTALVLPRGNDIERSGIIAPMDGMIRYSNEGGSEGFEGRVLGVWQPLGGAAGLTGATNGLNVNGSNVELGGSLTTKTDITSNGFEFSILRGSPSNAPTMHLYNNNGNLGTGGVLVLEGMNSATDPAVLGMVEARMTNATSASESSELVLSVRSSGAVVEGLKIDDAGELNANAYKYNSPITKYYGIAPIDFSLTRPGGAGDNYLQSIGGNSVFVNTMSPGEIAEIAAPVHLPDGATIQAVEIFGRNTSGQNATVHFVAKSYSTAVTFDDTVVVPDGTSGISGFNIGASVGKVVDNNANNYFIYIEIPTGTSTDFSGARITYSMSYAD